MSKLQDHIIDTFGHRLRTRVSGICVRNDEILLIKHHAVGKSDILWAPPGGGMQFGETAGTCLKREMFEECGLIVEIGKLLFVYEYLDHPLHAIELFFEIKNIEGNLQKGFDPELDATSQIIADVRWMPYQEIHTCPSHHFHGILHKARNTEELLTLQGYFHCA